MSRRDPQAFADFVAARSGALQRAAYLMVGDDDHDAAIGFRQENGDGPIDVLTCTVSDGTCSLVADDTGTLKGGFTIPTGTYIS
jgi:hypothetical protein